MKTLQLDVTVKKICILFFPVATFSIIGKISNLTILGFTVYEKAGDIRNILGFRVRGVRP